MALVLAALAPGAPVGAAAPRTAVDLRIELDEPVGRAGETLAVGIVAVDDHLDPVDADVALSSDPGELGAVERVATGRYRVVVSLPQRLPTRPLLLLARTRDAWSERVVPLVAGRPASLEITAPAAAESRAASPVIVGVTLTDAFGNLVDVEVRAEASGGELSPSRRLGAGRWQFDYRPPRVLDDRQEAITVEAGTARSTRSIRVESRSSWGGLGAWAGAATTAGEVGPAFGVEGSWWWRDERDRLGILVDAGWWSGSERVAVSLPGGPAELATARNYVPVTAALGWAHELGARVSGWVAAGGGGVLVSSAQTLGGQPTATEAGWAPAGLAALGVGMRAGRGVPFVEARAMWIGDTGLSTFTGSAQAFLLLAGYRFDAR